MGARWRRHALDRGVDKVGRGLIRRRRGEATARTFDRRGLGAIVTVNASGVKGGAKGYKRRVRRPGAGIPVAKTISPKDLRNIKVFAIDSITTRGNDGEPPRLAQQGGEPGG